MSVKKAISKMMTGKDNETHDIVRVIMAVVALTIPFTLIWGLSMETYRTIYSNKDYQIVFDLKDVFSAYFTFLEGAAVFLGGGGLALLLKRQTEPDPRTNNDPNYSPENNVSEPTNPQNQNTTPNQQ